MSFPAGKDAESTRPASTDVEYCNSESSSEEWVYERKQSQHQSKRPSTIFSFIKKTSIIFALFMTLVLVVSLFRLTRGGREHDMQITGNEGNGDENHGPSDSEHQVHPQITTNVPDRPSVVDVSGTQYIQKSPCGRTAAEAKAKGCHFELLNFSWLPSNCHDHELVERFKHIKEWKFWAHQNQTGLITQEDAQSGEYDAVWTEWDYHRHHCVNMWRKLHRALPGDGASAIDSVLAQLGHTHHCGNALLDSDTGLDVVNNVAFRKFPDCGVVVGYGGKVAGMRLED